MYTPIKTTQGYGQRKTTTLMGKAGVNLRDLPQLLDPKYATDIKNYILLTDGGLKKRKGFETYFTITDIGAITLLEKYNDDFYIYAAGTKLKYYEISTDTSGDIKTYGGTRTFCGQRYGDYYFVTTGQDYLVRVSRTLAYDTQTANYTVGKKLTGATSGATAIILEDSDSGATGTLTLGQISGAFTVGETITDDNSAPGSAKVTSVLAWTATDVTAAPIAAICKAIGNRLFLGRLKTDESAIAYSSVDTGGNPPFATWTTGTLADDPGQVNFRNAGQANAIEALGSNIIVFADKGKWAFYINTIDSAGTLSKVDIFTISRLDLGGARCAKTTPVGLLYANEAGLWRLVSVGQPNIPYSDQEEMVSDLLGANYFDDVDLTQADLMFHAKYNTVFLTCRKESETNNHLICYNTVNKAFSYFNGWNINRFFNDNNDKYLGASSKDTTVYELFSGYQDGTREIWTNYEQELNIGDLERLKTLLGGYLQGDLSPATVLTINFDIWDKSGTFYENKLSLKWTASGSLGGSLGGYGVGSWGLAGWGSDGDLTGTLSSLAGFRQVLNNIMRIKIKISGNDKVIHKINWASLITKDKQLTRLRNLTVN